MIETLEESGFAATRFGTILEEFRSPQVRRRFMRTSIFCIGVVTILVSSSAPAQKPATQAERVIFQQGDGEVLVKIDDEPIATYIYKDSEIPRPYFAHVRSLDGIQVTRNHPPRPGMDRRDHQTMHPGIWMAFGDLDGSDFWRNKAEIKHVRFVRAPKANASGGGFSTAKHYLRPDGSLICEEEFRFSIHLLPQRYRGSSDYLLVWNSTFKSDNQFYFGDQEEMGLGLRVATPLSEVNGGKLRDSEGRKGAEQIWSHAARWCDYSGVIDDQKVGMTIMCHPENFRESWMHARDYGFVAANPFGRNAMKKGKTSKVKVKPHETLQLRYAILVHSGSVSEDLVLETFYNEYLNLASRLNK